MHVVVVVNILNNHSSHVVYNTRPQAYDTEPFDREKTSLEENMQKIHISFYCHLYPNLSRIFRDFPQELNFNFLIHDTTHLQGHIGEEIVW